jgi:hypothetical protein
MQGKENSCGLGLRLSPLLYALCADPSDVRQRRLTKCCFIRAMLGTAHRISTPRSVPRVDSSVGKDENMACSSRNGNNCNSYLVAMHFLDLQFVVQQTLYSHLSYVLLPSRLLSIPLPRLLQSVILKPP